MGTSGDLVPPLLRPLSCAMCWDPRAEAARVFRAAVNFKGRKKPGNPGVARGRKGRRRLSVYPTSRFCAASKAHAGRGGCQNTGHCQHTAVHIPCVVSARANLPYSWERWESLAVVAHSQHSWRSLLCLPSARRSSIAFCERGSEHRHQQQPLQRRASGTAAAGGAERQGRRTVGRC